MSSAAALMSVQHAALCGSLRACAQMRGTTTETTLVARGYGDARDAASGAAPDREVGARGPAVQHP